MREARAGRHHLHILWRRRLHGTVLFLLHQVIGTPAKEVIIGAELFVFYFYILTVLLYIPFVYDSVATETTGEGAKPKDPSLV